MALQFISLLVISFIIWLGFTGSFALAEVLLGLVVSVVVAIILSKYSRFRIGLDFPVRVFRFVILFVPIFIMEMVKANIDVAKRVLNPSLPINPSMVEVKTDLKGEISKLILANSITLTPGTLTVDIGEDRLLVHWIDKKADEPERIREAISGKFEKRIGGIFE
ncbi:Na+/H+ antiporter subunit E [Mesotoga sp.]|uniref:Na+/H+ antiporter subunit E n=1 Tax=Mesotoga sp. TaxID=2053577 RepID=UPI001BD59FCF|nr:Na+/H+ antiporter subunit E [Mesotoga sp.]MDD3461416.1 Na+/H+ antiporter subunit E [Mesotoga sp.]